MLDTAAPSPRARPAYVRHVRGGEGHAGAGAIRGMLGLHDDYDICGAAFVRLRVATRGNALHGGGLWALPCEARSKGGPVFAAAPNYACATGIRRGRTEVQPCGKGAGLVPAPTART